MELRRPAAAGQFYPLSMTDLHDALEGCFLNPLGPGQLPPSHNRVDYFAAVVPHAGYTYSGPIAAHSYYALSGMRRPDLIVIIGPNHWGIGSSVSVYPEGAWNTPLGQVEVDASAAKYLAETSNIADLDALAHKQDHCIEVQLPFLQYIYGRGFKILPVILVLQDYSTAMELGRALALLAKRQSTLLLASSDFTHYEPRMDALDKDSRLIDTILSLDIQKFYRILERLNISACGYGAIASVMSTVKELGATDGRLLKYGTSGDVTGDHSAVVGYSSIVFE